MSITSLMADVLVVLVNLLQLQRYALT